MQSGDSRRVATDQYRKWLDYVSDLTSKLLIVVVDSDFQSGLELFQGTAEERRQYLSFLLSRLFFPFAPVGLAVFFIFLNVASSRLCSVFTVPVWYFINLVLTAYPFCVLWPWTPRKEKLWMDHLDTGITEIWRLDGSKSVATKGGSGGGVSRGRSKGDSGSAKAWGSRRRRSSVSFFEHAGESIFKVSRIILVYSAVVSLVTSLAEYTTSFQVCPSCFISIMRPS